MNEAMVASAERTHQYQTRRMEIAYDGNKALLLQHKTAFLCSRTVSSGAVLRCYDWAIDVDVERTVIVSGFQSKIEQDVLSLLSRRGARIILVLARRPYKVLPEAYEPFRAAGRLLIISTTTATRNAKEAAGKRNAYIAAMADELVFGYIGEGSPLAALAETYAGKTTILAPTGR